MNRDKFTDLIALADPGLRRLALLFQILRGKSDGDEGKDVRLVTNEGVSVDDAVGLQSDSVAEFNVVTDY